MSNFTELHLTHEIFSIHPMESQKFDIHFLGLHEKQSFVSLQTTNKLYLQPLKNVKKNVILFKLFWYGFCPLKVEITQFPDGFRLKLLQLSVPVFEKSFLTRREYAFCRSPHPTETYSQGQLERMPSFGVFAQFYSFTFCPLRKIARQF